MVLLEGERDAFLPIFSSNLPPLALTIIYPGRTSVNIFEGYIFMTPYGKKNQNTRSICAAKMAQKLRCSQVIFLPLSVGCFIVAGTGGTGQQMLLWQSNSAVQFCWKQPSWLLLTPQSWCHCTPARATWNRFWHLRFDGNFPFCHSKAVSENKEMAYNSLFQAQSILGNICIKVSYLHMIYVLFNRLTLVCRT